MDPFVSIAARVLYEERVAEGLRRQHRTESAITLVAGRSRPWQAALLTALAILGVR